MTQEEWSDILAIGSGSPLDMDRTETVVDAFLRQVAIKPHATAVVDAYGSMTYRELNEQSDAVASALMESGVKPGELVAIRLPRVKAFLVAVIGIWKAGAAYMPIDPTYPADRIRYMFDDSQAQVLIDESWINQLGKRRASCPALNKAQAEGMAIHIYTSGSTGRPKGVRLTHTAFRVMCHTFGSVYQYRSDDIVADVSSFGFMLSCADLFPPLVYGLPIHIISESVRSDVAALDQYIRHHGISLLSVVPQLGVPLVQDYHAPLRAIVMGGANVRIKQTNGVSIIVGYGLTETCGMLCFAKLGAMPDDGISLLGRPSLGATIVLEDEVGNPVPRGDIGEVCIASPQLAVGYWHNSELTSSVLVSRPWARDKVFRSGDMGRWNEDGILEFHGRRDDMVKIRGNRVEPGEVESALAAVEGVQSVAVVAKQINDETVLCGYYTSHHTLDESCIRKKMESFLPDYMVPSFLIRLDAMPTLPNGKTDKLSLPMPSAQGDIALPVTEFEQLVFPYVAALFPSFRLGVTTNLLRIGLTSLLAVKLSVILWRQCGVSIRSYDILAHPSIRDWELLCRSAQTLPVDKPAPDYPLSDNQMGIYLDWERNREGIQYNLPIALQFPRSIDANRLASALRRTIDCHPHLKARLTIREGRVLQCRRDDAPLPVAVEQLGRELDASFFQSQVRPFNLLKDDLARFAIYESPTATYLFADIHHIVFDGASFSVFFDTLARCFAGEQVAVEQVTAFDYALNDVRIKDNESFKQSANYFASILQGTESFFYPTSGAAQASGVLAIRRALLPHKPISAFCAHQGVTENSLFALTLMQVLHRLSREQVLQITTVSSSRSMTELSNSVGMFVRTLPLVSIDKDITLFDGLKQMQEQFVSMISNERCSFTYLADRYGIKPGVMYVYQGEYIDDIVLDGCRPVRIPLTTDTTIVPLTIRVSASESDYELALEYDAGLYDASAMDTLIQSICCLCLAMTTSHPDASLQCLPLVTEEESKQLLTLGTGDIVDYDRTKTFVDLFIAEAHKTPDHIAVADRDSRMTYAQLDEQSNTIAQWLIREHGVQPNDFVAVMLPRRKEFIAAVLGIMKAGGAYVPIDSDYPEERKRFMIQDCGAKAVITADALNHIMLTGYVATAVNKATPNGLAYMIYTSGSTGKPKGVMIPHSAYFNYLQFYVRQQALTQNDRMGCHRNFVFDASLEDLYPILTVGGQLHIMPEEIRLDMIAIRDFIVERGITCVSFTTSLGEMLLHEYPDLPLRYMVVSGEKLHPVENLRIPLWNFYGPTECTVDCVTCLIEPGKRYADVPIGRTVDNLMALVLDNHGHLIPRGAVGELCIAGPQVALGYCHQPELTDEKFVDCPYAQGQKMYHTSDLVRWNDEGQLEYIGRADRQVKLRGYRVEIGEIESVATTINGVTQAVATVSKDSLRLYYVGQVDAHTIRAELAQALTDYMLPSVYIQLDRMPLTAGGKVDRKALPEPQIKATQFVKPKTQTERHVFDIVSETLNTNQFGSTDNLVSIGMTSIAAIRLAAKLHRCFEISVRMTELMTHPTVKGLAELIESHSPDINQSGNVHPTRAYYPLTDNQKGLYIDWERHRSGLQYNVPYALKLTGVNALRLADALRRVINLHPILKMRLAHVDGVVWQQRDDTREAEVTVAALPRDVHSDRTSIQNFLQSRVRAFDLFADSLYRFEIYTRDNVTYLFKDIHHIITDGLSEGNLLSELRAAYDGAELKAEHYTFYDYALDAHSTIEDEDYFKQLISDTQATTYPRSLNASGEGKSRTVSIGLEKGRVDQQRLQQEVTASNYILHSLLQVLKSITGNERVLMAAISNGRTDDSMTGMQGFFVRTLPVLSENTASALQHQFMQTIDHEAYPLTRMMESIHIHPQILYAYEGELSDSIAGKAGVEQIPLRLDTPKMPLVITVNPDSGDEYILTAEYDDSLYTEQDMRTLLRCVRTMATEGRLISIQEEQQLIALGTGERLDYDQSKTLVDLFMEQAKRTPDNIAVVFKDRQYTYAQLDALTDTIAERLVTEGVRSETIVGVMIDRSERMVLYPLAIMKTGGTYMPLDSTYPTERLQTMCDDAGVRIIVSEEHCVEDHLPDYIGKVILTPENDKSGYDHVVLPKTKPDCRFVILYTSGSTGKPKGVELTYRGIVNFCHWYVKAFDMTPSDRSLAYAAFSFDAHMMDLYPALSCGASVYIVPTELRWDVLKLNAYMEQERITIAFLTTQLGHLFAGTMDNQSLRLLSVGGENLPFVSKPRYRFYNGYGPTECTIYSSTYEVTDAYRMGTIGRPVANTTVAIVDRALHLVPKGVVGELLIGGPGVAKGYFHEPDLTAAKFVDCPYLPGQKMYRTGDLVRWNALGDLEFVSRVDSQIKLRGFRIEPGEIESAAMRIAGVNQALASVRNDTLCLYYTGAVNEADIQVRLAKTLPVYMVPTVYTRMDTMPMTPNGKVDPHALPQPVLHHAESVTPVSPSEVLLCQSIARALGLQAIGMTDNLKSLGLTSIKVMHVMSLLARVGWSGCKFEHIANASTVRDILERSTADRRECGYWLCGYDNAKPTVVLVCGVISDSMITRHLMAWSSRYNLYVLQPVFNAWADYSYIGYAEMLSRYEQQLLIDIPSQSTFHALVGFSFGGELAYHLADRWRMARFGTPVVLMGDTRMELEFDGFDADHLADWQKLSFTFGMEIIRRLTRPPFPSYKGKTVLFSAAQAKGAATNETAWRNHDADIEIHIVHDSHHGLYENPNHYDLYFNRLVALDSCEHNLTAS